MAKQPENLVVRILREIPATQADQSKKFEEIEQRLDELHDGMITSLGLASHANVRSNSITKDINDLKKRVRRLESKV
jgi:hypothetical protein